MPHENVFYTEKYSNDSLHNPRRNGTSHTSKEIQQAADLLGRNSIAEDERARTEKERKRRNKDFVDRVIKNSSEDLGHGFVLVGSGTSSVRRIDTSNIIQRGVGGRETVRTMTTKKGGDGVKFKSDSDERWKTEERIKKGGTGGQAQLNEARAAALELENNKKINRSSSRLKDDDEDSPIVVLPDEMIFGEDGFVLMKSINDDKEDVDNDNLESMMMIELARKRKAKKEEEKNFASSRNNSATTRKKRFGL